MKQRLYSYFYDASLFEVIINFISPVFSGTIALMFSILGGSIFLAIISSLLILLAVIVARTRYMLSKLYKNGSKWEVAARNSVVCKLVNKKFGVEVE